MTVEEIFVFDFDFNTQILLNYWNAHAVKSKPYTDKRFGKFVMNNWRIVNDVDLPYAQELAEMFDIQAVAKFYMLQANTSLPMHVDQDTTCSINFLLSGKAAPVKYSTGNEWYYKTALLNTSIKHGVDSCDEDRILFKLSTKEPFDIVKQKIINTLSRS